MTREQLIETYGPEAPLTQENFPEGSFYAGNSMICEIVQWITATFVKVNGYKTFTPGDITPGTTSPDVEDFEMEVPEGYETVAIMFDMDSVVPDEAISMENTEPATTELTATGEDIQDALYTCLIGIGHPHLKECWQAAQDIEGDPITLLMAALQQAYAQDLPALYAVAADVRTAIARWGDYAFPEGATVDLAKLLSKRMES